jgi:hypothetical protein
MPLPPQSVQKTRARRVFGDFVSDAEDDSSRESTSLCYTETDVDTVYSSSVATEKRSSTATVVKRDPPKMIDISSRKSSESTVSSNTVSSNKENSAENASTLSAAPPRKVAPSRAALPRVAPKKRRDLVKQTQTAINNATVSVNETLNAAREARKINFEQRSRETSQVRNQWKEEKEEANTYHEEAEKMRHGLLNLQRQLSSKYQHARAKSETEKKHARLDAITQESQFKSQVYQDHHRTLKEERNRKRRESTQARAKLRQNNREGEDKLNMLRIEEDQALHEERHEAVKASTKCKQESADNRRQSFQFRNGDARRIRELYDNLKQEDQHREHQSFELKLGGARDANAYKKQLEEYRRQSFAGRNAHGKKQRDLVKDQEATELAKEQASYRLKWDGEKDAEAYQREMEKERRESLAGRNMTGKQQRDLMENLRLEALSKEQANIQLKINGERDAEAYRQKMAEERRVSFAGRNAHGKKQRDLQVEMDSKAQYDESASYELKWGGERDAEAYTRQMEKERRESLAQKNKDSVRHAKVMEELRDIAHEKETESFALKWAGENDAKEYLANCEEERRQSLNFRNKEGSRHRQIEEEQRMQALAEVQQDEVLRAQGRKDMEAYKKECSERDRKSLEFRQKEANVQRVEEKRVHQQEYEVEQGNRALVDAANWDVKEYIQDCQSRRRLSLAFRAKEKRHNRRWEQKQADQALAKRMQDSRLRSKDRREREIAHREERRRVALDAIRHAGCSFNVNGAASLRVDY